jgi:uncharacterized phage protein gp47/JayE
MGLKIKSFQDILKGAVDWVANNSNRLIDFSVGSAIRTLLEAVSTELEEYYFKTYQNYLWAIENAVYESFGFTRREAVSAYGNLTITFAQKLPDNLLIAKGTRFSSQTKDDYLYFETQQDYTVLKDSLTATIEVYCTTKGKVGNVAADTITLMTNFISYVSSVTNPERFMTGRDAETVSERKARFTQFVETRSKATIPALEYGTREVEEVTGVYVDDSQTGIVKVFAHDAAGNLPQSIIDKINTNLYNYKAGGIPVFVMPIAKNNLNVTLEVTVLSQYNTVAFKQMISDSVRYYLDDFVSSQDFISSDLNALVRSLDEIAIKNCKITAPVGDVSISDSELIRSGTVTVTLINA